MNNPNLGGATKEEYGGRVEEQIAIQRKALGSAATDERFAEVERAAGVPLIKGPGISDALRHWEGKK